MDPEPYSGTRPYQCRTCGRAMRTRGVDGVCFSCLNPTPLRCARCARVKWLPPDYSADWQDHPGKLPAEIEVMCPTCTEMRGKELSRRYYAAVREVAQRQARGYGPAPEGVDVWKGFHE